MITDKILNKELFPTLVLTKSGSKDMSQTS